MKQSLAAQVGVPRFRQRFLSEEFHAIPNDQVFTFEDVKVQLALLEFCEPEFKEDRKLLSASIDNDCVALEELLQQPRNPNVTDVDGMDIPLNIPLNGRQTAAKPYRKDCVRSHDLNTI